MLVPDGPTFEEAVAKVLHEGCNVVGERARIGSEFTDEEGEMALHVHGAHTEDVEVFVGTTEAARAFVAIEREGRGRGVETADTKAELLGRILRVLEQHGIADFDCPDRLDAQLADWSRLLMSARSWRKLAKGCESRGPLVRELVAAIDALDEHDIKTRKPEREAEAVELLLSRGHALCFWTAETPSISPSPRQGKTYDEEARVWVDSGGLHASRPYHTEHIKPAIDAYLAAVAEAREQGWPPSSA